MRKFEKPLAAKLFFSCSSEGKFEVIELKDVVGLQDKEDSFGRKIVFNLKSGDEVSFYESVRKTYELSLKEEMHYGNNVSVVGDSQRTLVVDEYDILGVVDLKKGKLYRSGDQNFGTIPEKLEEIAETFDLVISKTWVLPFLLLDSSKRFKALSAHGKKYAGFQAVRKLEKGIFREISKDDTIFTREERKKAFKKRFSTVVQKLRIGEIDSYTVESGTMIRYE